MKNKVIAKNIKDSILESKEKQELIEERETAVR